MAVHVGLLVGLVLAMIAYTRLIERATPAQQRVSGDMWYVRQYAFVGGPISPPYCWRPLLPLLARYLGFPTVSYASLLATPICIYGLAGGGWLGVAAALAFIGNPHMFRIAVKNPEYDAALCHFLLAASLWAMAAESPAAWVLLLLASLVRESAGLSLAVVALLTQPWLAIAPVLGLSVAYLTRNESKENRHPHVESGILGTVRKWAGEKGHNAFHFAHVIQPLRALPLAVPFVWGELSHDARIGLLGFLVHWACAIPASGQNRIVGYSYAFFVPVIAALGVEYAWVYAMLSWWWPLDYNIFDESGGQNFPFLHGAEMQHMQPTHDAAKQAG